MTLTILGPDDPALQALEEACAAHPQLNASVKIIPWADYRNALLDALNAPATPYEAVCLPGHVWLPELTHAGHFFNLNDLTSEVEPATLAAYDASGLVPSVKAECHYQDQWVMLPLFTDGHIVFYRSDLLELPEQIRPSGNLRQSHEPAKRNVSARAQSTRQRNSARLASLSLGEWRRSVRRTTSPNIQLPRWGGGADQLRLPQKICPD